MDAAVAIEKKGQIVRTYTYVVRVRITYHYLQRHYNGIAVGG